MSHKAKQILALIALGVAGILPALAAPTAVSIPIAPYGDSSRGSVSSPVPLTPASYLCAVEGADGSFGTSDDVVLLVTGVGGTPVVTPVAVPHLPSSSGRIVRLSATRALAITAGTDATWKTADDAVIVLDRLGSGNTVTPIIVGGLDAADGWIPTPLDSRTAALASMGPDLLPNTTDDTVAARRPWG